MLEAERPSIFNLTHGTREVDLADSFRTIARAHRGEKALVVASITCVNSGATGSDMREPIPTVTANSWIKKPGGAAPLGMIAPRLASIDHGFSGGRREYSLEECFGTATVGSMQHALVAPHLLSLKGSGRRMRPIDLPHPTVLAEGNHSALIAPHVMTMHNSGKPFEGADQPTHHRRRRRRSVDDRSQHDPDRILGAPGSGAPRARHREAPRHRRHGRGEV